MLIVSQPTWGVDAGAAAAIHQALIDLARRRRRAGRLAGPRRADRDRDRIAVIAEGRVSPTRPVGDITVEEIGRAMGGSIKAAAVVDGSGTAG